MRCLWLVCEQFAQGNGTLTCGRWDIIYAAKIVQRRIVCRWCGCEEDSLQSALPLWVALWGWADHQPRGWSVGTPVTLSALFILCPLGLSFCCCLGLVMYYFIVVWSSWHWNTVGVRFNVWSTAEVMWHCWCVLFCIAVLIIMPCINCVSFIHVRAKQKASN